MKVVALTASLVLLSVTSLHAQDGDGKQRGGNHGFRHGGDPLTHLTEQLNLDDQQADEVAAIFEESRALHREIQASVQSEHCAVRENTIQELASVLNEEQMAELESLQSQRRNRGSILGMPRFANCEI